MNTHDILHGAAEIAQHLYGKNTQATRQRIHRMAATSMTPIFRVGGTLCARPGKLGEFLDNLETSEQHPETTAASGAGQEGAA